MNDRLPGPDRFLISYYNGSRELGIYSAGYMICMYLGNLIQQPIALASAPIFTRIYTQQGDAATKDFLANLLAMLGMAVFPVFAGFTFGPAVIFGPTGGYILAFPIAAYLVGAIIEKNKSVFAVAGAMILGTAVILLTGALYLTLFLNYNFSEAFFAGVAIFSIWGLIKIAAASSVYLSLRNKYPKLP